MKKALRLAVTAILLTAAALPASAQPPVHYQHGHPVINKTIDEVDRILPAQAAPYNTHRAAGAKGAQAKPRLVACSYRTHTKTA